MAETLNSGDLTTAFRAWLDTLTGDLVTTVRDRLVTNYTAASTADVTTLLARFLRDRS